MSQYVINKIETLVDAGTSFASAITTKEVKLDNYQSAKVVVTTGEGEATKTTANTQRENSRRNKQYNIRRI